VVTAGLCRVLARRGVRVAPFKAQNMSNNSMVIAGPDGGGAEIGRAQWVQAVAANATPEVAMNPVLLKPGSDRGSHVVVNGRPAGQLSSAQFVDDRRALGEAAFAAYDDLASRFDVVVCEGAGSPAEINLRAHDFVNMGLARHAGMPVLVVGDIDRGGVYAALYGTLALLETADQRLVAGFVLNKFRGEQALLAAANEALLRLTGRPIVGVLPWTRDVWLDSEDGLNLSTRGAAAADPLQVAVVRFPRISNFTDLDALGLEPDVQVRYAARPAQLADADLVVLPGTRATMADLAWLRARGLDTAITAHASAGRAVLGVCGGFQMLGVAVADPEGVEGQDGSTIYGLGLLDTRTTFVPTKVLRLSSGHALGAPVCGYEIHHGVTHGGNDAAFVGGVRRENVFGTMWHGCLESDAFRGAFLAEVAAAVGRIRLPSNVCFQEARQQRLDHLADLLEQHLDLEAVLGLIRDGPPAALPVLLPGRDDRCQPAAAP
ncbi:MAG: cobyric acid synthase, partial [Dermatophilaceae bacterium]